MVAKVDIEPAGDVQRETLLDIERTNMMMAPGIASITFFKGSLETATAVLKERLRLVVAANPWTCLTL